MNKELVKEIVEYYRVQEAAHFEQTELLKFSEKEQNKYWNIDFADKVEIYDFLEMCKNNNTNHIYYKLMKLKYDSI